MRNSVRIFINEGNRMNYTPHTIWDKETEGDFHMLCVSSECCFSPWIWIG